MGVLRAVSDKVLRIGVWVGFAVFLAGFFYQLKLLGFDNDGAMLGGWSFYAVELIKNRQGTELLWQLMQYSYCGRLGSVLFMPFVFVGLKSVFFFRVSSLPLILAGIACMYLVVKNWFNVFTARVFIFLLLTNSFFIRVVRVASKRDELYQVAFFWIALWLFNMAFLRKKPVLLGLGAFVCGVAFWTKIMFLGYFFAALCGGLCLVPFYRNGFLPFSSPWFKKGVWFSVAGFLLGSLPWTLSNIAFDFGSVKYFFHAVTVTRPGGWENWDIVKNLGIRFAHLGQFLFSTSGSVDGVGMVRDVFGAVLFFCSVLAVLFFLLFRPGFVFLGKSRLVFFLVLYGVLFFLTCFVPVSGIAEHMVVLFPVSQLMLAFALSIMVGRVAREWLKWVVLAFLLVYACVQVGYYIAYARDLASERFKLVGWSQIPAQVAGYFTHKVPNDVVLVSLVEGVEDNVRFHAYNCVRIAGGWQVHPAFVMLEDHYKNEIEPLVEFYLLVPEKFEPREINAEVLNMIKSRRSLKEVARFSSGIYRVILYRVPGKRVMNRL